MGNGSIVLYDDILVARERPVVETVGDPLMEAVATLNRYRLAANPKTVKRVLYSKGVDIPLEDTARRLERRYRAGELRVEGHLGTHLTYVTPGFAGDHRPAYGEQTLEADIRSIINTFKKLGLPLRYGWKNDVREQLAFGGYVAPSARLHGVIGTVRGEPKRMPKPSPETQEPVNVFTGNEWDVVFGSDSKSGKEHGPLQKPLTPYWMNVLQGNFKDDGATAK